MSWITDEARAEMAAINAGISHSRRGPATAKYLRYVDGELVWLEDPEPVRQHSMFPYKSTAMCVDPEDVPKVAEQLRKQGVFVEFDRGGRPIIESAKQQSDLAKALGMKTGRDGYGHTDEYGRFHNSGRRRADEVATGRAKVRKAIETLNVMPEESPTGAVADVLREYDIMPNEANTG
jgi:biotin operon repressor